MVNGKRLPRIPRKVAASGHLTRPTGVIVLVLLVVSVALALYLAHLYRLGVPQTLVTVLVGGGTLAGLYLAWATYRDSRRDAVGGESSSLKAVADQLARLVGRQWENEAKVRHLDEPYPLPASWVAVNESMADAWDVLVTLATTGHGWPAPPPAGIWAASPNSLAGSGRDLLTVLERVPTGRLVLLGEPGAGKTMLMVGLILDVLADRTSGDPVPVLVSLASWNPEEQALESWLASQLTTDYPPLLAAAPPSEGEGTRLDALLAADLLFPILDGLDEIPEAIRGRAINKINDSLRPGRRLVVTCRTEQYREAVDKGSNVHAAGVVQLCPLAAGAISAYLEAVGGPGTAKRWAPVLATLGTQSPVAEALVRPLMVGLARIIYSPRLGELAGKLRDPKELCVLADRAAVESHLFDAFIPAAYNAGPTCRWTARQADVWLEFLARHLEYNIKNPDYAWWELKRTLRINLSKLGTSPSSGIRVRITDFIDSFLTGPIAGIGFAILALIVDGIRFAIGYRVNIVHDIVGALAAGLAISVFAILRGLWAGLKSVPGNLALAANPRAVLARDRHAALALWLGAALGFGLLPLVLTFFKPAIINQLSWWVLAGFVLGFVVSIREMAWPSYSFARGWLALRHRLPWSLMDFLDDAHKRGVLRQAGAVYQFRHIELQHRLATRKLFINKPERCPYGHSLVPSMPQKISWLPCMCPPARKAAERGRGMGHMTLRCGACSAEDHPNTIFYEPPHKSPYNRRPSSWLR